MSMDTRAEVIMQLEEYGKMHRGRTEFLKYLNGGKLTATEAIAAACYDCTGYYDQGAVDCEDEICPLRPFMPFVSKELKHVGRVLSEEQKEKIRERMKKMREIREAMVKDNE